MFAPLVLILEADNIDLYYYTIMYIVVYILIHLCLHLPGGDDFCEGVVQDGLVGDEVEEVDPVLVEGQDVLVGVVGRPPGVVALSANLQQWSVGKH